MPTVLIVAGTQPTTSDLHLLYRRAFERAGWRAVLLAHDSALPFWERALQQARLFASPAHHVLVNQRVRAAARTLRPDLTLVSGSNWYLTADTLAAVRQVSGRVALNEQHAAVLRRHQAAALPLYDHVFTQDSALVPMLREATRGRGVSLLGPACDPDEHRPRMLDEAERSRFGSDVCCVGWGYENRVALFEHLTSFDIRLWGFCWDASPALRPFFRAEPVYGLKKTKIYSASRTVINLQSTTYQVDGVTCRPFEVLACGSLCLSEPKKDLSRYFTPGEEIVTFEGPEDLRHKLTYYLARPVEARDIAARGRARALREHTYAHRVSEMLDTLGLAS